VLPAVPVTVEFAAAALPRRDPRQEDLVVIENPAPYPVRVDASLDAPLSRGLWLVKWLLLLPHYVVLAFLWLAFTVLTVVAFFAILVTGRYPRSIFDFNLGVLRWSWRVHYYGYGALGTDRYPPFTLADVPDYPAHLDVPYPERLSRGLVLVKWWLLALPHYLVVALFVGGGIWLGTGGRTTDGVWDDGWAAGGLVGLLVLIAGLVLLFSGRYPAAIYDFVLGMDRWVLRVAAYVGLMTDRYPPFRLDLGGSDPPSIPTGPAPVAPAGTGTVPAPGPAAAFAGGPGTGGPQGRPWGVGRVIALVVGAVLLLISTGVLLGGGALLWADRTQRDDGFVWTDTSNLRTSSYALVSDNVQLDMAGEEWVLDRFLGTARIEVTADDPDTEVFVGVARTAAVSDYLRGVGYSRVDALGPRWNGGTGPGTVTGVAGGAPGVPPTDSDVWVAESSGPGTQALDWRPADGNWTAVVMRVDGAPRLAVDVRAGATAPALGAVAGGLLGVGAVLLVVGALLVALAVRSAQGSVGTGVQAPPPLPTPRPAGSEEAAPAPTPAESS
jgi:hypothetical protein